MDGFEAREPAAPIMIGGEPWRGCPGSLAGRLAVAQARLYAWHTEGRLGAEVARANPRLVANVESYVAGQMAARAAQHRQELERVSRHG